MLLPYALAREAILCKSLGCELASAIKNVVCVPLHCFESKRWHFPKART